MKPLRGFRLWTPLISAIQGLGHRLSGPRKAPKGPQPLFVLKMEWGKKVCLGDAPKRPHLPSGPLKGFQTLGSYSETPWITTRKAAKLETELPKSSPKVPPNSYSEHLCASCFPPFSHPTVPSFLNPLPSPSSTSVS